MFCFFIRVFIIILQTIQVYFCTFLYLGYISQYKEEENEKEKASQKSQYVTLMDTINLPTKLGIKYGWDGVSLLTLFTYEFSFWRIWVKPYNSPESPPLMQPETSIYINSSTDKRAGKETWKKNLQQHPGRQAQGQGLSIDTCHLILAAALPDSGMLTLFQWQETWGSQRLILQKATEQAGRMLAQGQLTEDSSLKYTKFIDLSNIPNSLIYQWRKKDLGIGKTRKQIMMNKTSRLGIQRPDSSLSSLESHISLPETHSGYPDHPIFLFLLTLTK